MRDKRGFTLVELLVTISILGIIVGMTIPLVRNIQRGLESKKYETYGKAMLSSAKVYRHDYNDDLFGHHNSGCASVTLEELIEKGLIKDFPDNKISCKDKNGDSKVSIVKVGKQYGYSYELYCGNIDDGNFDRVGFLYSDRVADCGDDINMASISTVYGETKLSESHSEKIKLTSSTGINFSTLSISYSWIAADTLENVDVTSPKIEWKPLAFRSISESKQKDIIFNKGESVSMTSDVVTTPKGEAENYALVLRINSLKNLALDDLEVEKAIESHYKVFGIYEVGQTYTVTYDSNGGSECKPGFVSVFQNKKATQTLEDANLCVPTKEDNKFKEWNTKKDGTGVSINNSSIITQNIKVYAQWVLKTAPKITFKIYLDENDKFTQKVTTDSGVVYTWGKNGNILTRKINNGAVSDYTYEILKGRNITMNLPNYNNTKYINIYRDNYIVYGSSAWKCVSGCSNTNQVFSQGNVVINDTSKVFNKDTVTIKVNWGLPKPNKPTITNPYYNKWVKSNYKISLKTTSKSNIIGKWYYSTNAKNYKEYANQAGKTAFQATVSAAAGKVFDGNIYVRVCNKMASGPTDNDNCSANAVTKVRIDREKPVVQGYGIKASNEGGLYGSKLVSSECKNNKKVTGHCDSRFKVTCRRGPATCNWSWDYQFECVDGSGSGCVKSGGEFWHQIKWLHNGWESRKCRNWTSVKNCGLRLGDTRATWVKLYIRVKDNVGNFSDEFYFYNTCSWCNDDRNACG